MIITVKYGSDLPMIAGYYYGNPMLWDIIYFENQELIGDDPEALEPGMELVIPDIELSEGKYVVPTPEAA